MSTEQQRRLERRAQREAEKRRQCDAALAALATDVDEHWREEALCAQIDPDLFFPEKGGPTRDAKKMCLTCTVRAECLRFALENDERFGIWGGLSERERRRLVRGDEQEAS